MILTTLICLENATNINFTLLDRSNHVLLIVAKNGYYYIKLTYNEKTITKYTFKHGNMSFNMGLNNIGRITQIMPDNMVHLEIKDMVQHPPDDIDPVCRLSTPKLKQNNKLLITPINNVDARADVPVTQYNFDLSYGT